MQLDRSALDEHRLKRLNAESVQCRSTVEQHRVVLDDVLEDVPNDDVLRPLNHALGVLDVAALAHVDELLHHKGLEQLQRHLLGDAALIHLELRSDDDDRTAGIVDALTEQVLTETSLLASEQRGERFELSVAGSADRLAAPAVLNQGVDSLLKHSLLVADDDVGRAEFDELLEPVVAVDDPAIEVVEVAGRISAAVERDHRAQLGRKHRKHVENHPFGTGIPHAERLNHLEPLDRLELALSGVGGRDNLLESVRLFVEVNLHQQLFDRFGAHADAESAVTVFVEGVAVFALVENLLFDEVRLAGIDDDVLEEVQHLLHVLGGHVERKRNARRHALEIPNVGDGRGELDVSHPLASDVGASDLDAALVADDALVAYALVFAAMALPVLGRTEDSLAEQPVFLRLLRPVVDCLGLCDLTVRPRPDLLRRGNANLY